MLNKDLIIRLIERRSMVVYDMSPRNIYCPLQSLSFDLVTISRKRRHKLIFLLRSLILDIRQEDWFMISICLLHFLFFAKITRSDNTGASIEFIHPIYSRCLCARPIYRQPLCACVPIYRPIIYDLIVSLCAWFTTWKTHPSPLSLFAAMYPLSLIVKYVYH